MILEVFQNPINPSILNSKPNLLKKKTNPESIRNVVYKYQEIKDSK